MVEGNEFQIYLLKKEEEKKRRYQTSIYNDIQTDNHHHRRQENKPLRSSKLHFSCEKDETTMLAYGKVPTSFRLLNGSQLHVFIRVVNIGGGSLYVPSQIARLGEEESEEESRKRDKETKVGGQTRRRGR